MDFVKHNEEPDNFFGGRQPLVIINREDNGVGVVYEGYAYQGTQPDDTSWRIKLTFTNGSSVSVRYSAPNVKWTDRKTLTYK